MGDQSRTVSKSTATVQPRTWAKTPERDRQLQPSSDPFGWHSDGDAAGEGDGSDLGGGFSLLDSPMPVQPQLQRQPQEESDNELEDEFEIQAKCASCEAEETLQRQPESDLEAGLGDELGIQEKLSIGQPGDRYEQEADSVAAQVMKMPDPSLESESLQRQELGDSETEDTHLQTQPLAGQISQGVQLKAAGQSKGNQASAGLETSLKNQSGKGQPLGQETRDFMESRFGSDLGGVRVHTDEPAVKMNREVGAKAFTHGQDIYFNSGQYNPGSGSGKELLAHELTHTHQQGGSQLKTKALQPSSDAKIQEKADLEVGIQHKKTSLSINHLPRTSPETKSTSHSKEPAQNNKYIKVKQNDFEAGEKNTNKEVVSKDKKASLEQQKDVTPKAKKQSDEAANEVKKPPEPLVKEKQIQDVPEKEKKDNKKSDHLHKNKDKDKKNKQSEPSSNVKKQVEPIKQYIPTDAAGMPLPQNPAIEAQILALTQQAQGLRESGSKILEQAAKARDNAETMSNSLESAQEQSDEVDEKVEESVEDQEFRRETIEHGQQALETSEEKATTVSDEAPEFVDKANQGQSDSQPIAEDSSQLSGENSENVPDDPEAAGKSQEQGQKLTEVSSDTKTVDETLGDPEVRAEGLIEEAAQAKATNDQVDSDLNEAEDNLDKIDDDLTEITNENEEVRGETESLSSSPDELRAEADLLEAKGQGLIEASFAIEQKIQGLQAEYYQQMSSIQPLEPQLNPDSLETREKRGYNSRKRIDFTEGVSNLLYGSPTEEERQAAVEAAEEKRSQQLQTINELAGESFEDLTAADKIGIAMQLMAEDFIEWFDPVQMRINHLEGRLNPLTQADPRASLIGIVDGFGQILSGGANLLSAEQWEADPLGNALKSAADIASGLTTLLSSIAGLAGAITAILTAVTALSLGLSVGVTGPIILFCGKVTVKTGTMAFKTSKIAAILRSALLIKNLVNGATAETAEELQGYTEDAKQDVVQIWETVNQGKDAKDAAQASTANLNSIDPIGGGMSPVPTTSGPVNQNNLASSPPRKSSHSPSSKSQNKPTAPGSNRNNSVNQNSTSPSLKPGTNQPSNKSNKSSGSNKSNKIPDSAQTIKQRKADIDQENQALPPSNQRKVPDYVNHNPDNYYYYKGRYHAIDKKKTPIPPKIRQELFDKHQHDAITGELLTNDNKTIDHIFPESKIKGLDGFNELTPEQQKLVLNDPHNFQVLSQSNNSSKGNRTEVDQLNNTQLANELDSLTLVNKDRRLKFQEHKINNRGQYLQERINQFQKKNNKNIPTIKF